MAVVDAVLVDVKVTPFRNESIPTYINRDKVVFYSKHMDSHGNISEELTDVYLQSADGIRVNTVNNVLSTTITVFVSLSDFNTLMTAL